MKKLLIVTFLFIQCCVAVFVVTSCTNRFKGHDSVEAVSCAADTSDTELAGDLISETTMPKAADEVFDDFLFNFAASKRLQLSRINFPIHVEGSLKQKLITQEEWKAERFFIYDDYYTLFFDNERQEERAKSTAISHAIVEKIYLERNYVRQYVFDRNDGEWRLTGIRNTTFDGSPNASFLKFYDQFVVDSLFQMESISANVKYSGPDPDDDFATIDGVITSEQWPSFAPPLPAGMIYNIVYGEGSNNSDTKLFVIRGIANGEETSLTFQRKSDRWMLVQLAQ